MKPITLLNKLLCICFMLIVVSGCGAMNPFVEPNMLRPDIKWEESESRPGYYIQQRDSNGIYKSNDVTVAQARMYARSLQDAYRAAATGQIRERVGIDGVIIGTTATAIGIAATGGHAETAGLLGLGAGTLAYSGDRFLISSRRRIWLIGALALECVIKATNSNVTMAPSQIVLSVRLNELENASNNLKKYLKNTLPACKPEAEDLLSYADEIYKKVEESKNQLNPLGQILLSKVIDIRIRVDTEVSKTDPDLLSFNDAIEGLLTNTSAISTLPNNGYFKTLKTRKPPLSPDPCSNLSIKVLGAIDKVLSALKDAIKAGPMNYSDSLFSDCTMIGQIGFLPLEVTIKESVIEAEGNSVHETTVHGGQRPYQVVSEILPANVSAVINSADHLTVTVKDVKKSDKGFAVPIKDTAGKITIFIIKVQVPKK